MEERREVCLRVWKREERYAYAATHCNNFIEERYVYGRELCVCLSTMPVDSELRYNKFTHTHTMPVDCACWLGASIQETHFIQEVHFLQEVHVFCMECCSVLQYMCICIRGACAIWAPWHSYSYLKWWARMSMHSELHLLLPVIGWVDNKCINVIFIYMYIDIICI